jgi:hypothetical protein
MRTIRSVIRGVFLSGAPDSTDPITGQVRFGLQDRDSGWWVALVLDAFSYLESDFGYELAEVQMHFKGNYIVYQGPLLRFVTTYEPDSTRSIGAEFWIDADKVPGAGPLPPASDQSDVPPSPVAFDVNRLLHARDPELRLPELAPRRLDKTNVADAIAIWARGLRELAPDVLEGTWPEGIPTYPLWVTGNSGTTR